MGGASPGQESVAAAGPRTGILRIVTCGAVDDGKSTLLGRLLLESGQIPTDQVAAVTATGGGVADPALLFDGLEAEREQGITIDVAHRTAILDGSVVRFLDAPGHEQYTGNLATAASQADLALLIVDAAAGLTAQTRRHALVCHLFGVRRLILVVNKMDLVGWRQDAFEAIRVAFADFARRIGASWARALPVSALRGDNVGSETREMAWWTGGTLLDHLRASPARSEAGRPLRLPVQLVERDGRRRRYLGTLASGRISVGEAVRLMPAGLTATVAALSDPDGPVGWAAAGTAVALELAEDVDLARGDVISDAAAPPIASRGISAKLLWFGRDALVPGRTYDLRAGTALVSATVTAVQARLDIATGDTLPARTLGPNELGLCEVALGAAVALDTFRDDPAAGAFVLVDRVDHATVGAGIVLHDLGAAAPTPAQVLSIDKTRRAAQKHQLPTVLWFTGLSGAGKSTLADRLEQRLVEQGRHTVLLDGDNVRRGLNRDLGFDAADRVENIRRIGEVAKLMLEGGLIVLCAFISPFRAERDLARSLVEPDEFLEIYVDTPVAECARRDPKGLYARATAGEIANFTGISSPYEPPETPELHLRTMEASADRLTDLILAEMRRRGRLP